MKQIKVLLLGGAYAQVPVIKEARNRGWYIITCDYLPDNPGHALADEFHNVSTTEKEKVLEVAKKRKVDYIVAYASDVAVPTAAYVSEELGLPYNSLNSVRILTEKDLFRKFLKENGLNMPTYYSLESAGDLDYVLENMTFPFIIKPTDSAGSKGVTKVNARKEAEEAYYYALSYSRNKRVIAEEFIDNEIADLHGDGFVVDGKLEFICLGDHIFSSDLHPFNPSGTVWPSRHDEQIQQQIRTNVQLIIERSGFFQGAINVEARVNSKGKLYIMEVGPRNGGHFVPQAIGYCTGFDMIKALCDITSGEKVTIPDLTSNYTAYYAMHSDKSGKLKGLEIDPELVPFVKDVYRYIDIGNEVMAFNGANAAIGVALLLFPSREQMNYYMSKIEKYIMIEIE